MLKSFIYSKKGAVTMVEFLIVIAVLTFTIFSPVAFFAMIIRNISLDSVLNSGLQAVSVEGGLTDEALEVIYLNLEARGFLPQGSTPAQRAALTQIISNTRTGSTVNLVHRRDANPEISLTIKVVADSQVDFLNGILRIITAADHYDRSSGQHYYHSQTGYVLSELK